MSLSLLLQPSPPQDTAPPQGTPIVVPPSDKVRNRKGIHNIAYRNMKQGEKVTLLEAIDLLIREWDW